MELMKSAIDTHIFAILFFLAIMLFNLYSLKTHTNFVKLVKRFRVMTPVYHFANAVVIYTGTIVAFYAHHFSITIALMIPTSIFLLVIEIKKYKKMRVIKSTDIKLQEQYVLYAQKICLIEIAVLVAVFVISKAF